MTRSEWQPPRLFKVESTGELNDLVNDTRADRVIDQASVIADDLFELHHPGRVDDIAARESFRASILEEGASFGTWVYYPWSGNLVRFADAGDHYDLRTFRNRNLVTKEEQLTLRGKKGAAFGMSVGSNEVDAAVQLGIGNEYLLFDYDRLAPTNLNRIRATMAQVGLYKTTVEGQKIAELDPYISQHHYTEGYTDDTDDILRRERPDFIIEAIDDVAAKARLRRVAEELRVPLVMAGDVGDVSTIDIERHDIGGVKPFNGKLTNAEYQALIDGTIEDKDGALMKIVGKKNLTTRLIDSAMLRGIEIGGLPQLGTTATAGGALAGVAIRDILLGRKIPSSSHAVNLRKAVGASSPTTLAETIQTLNRFIRYRKTQQQNVETSRGES